MGGFEDVEDASEPEAAQVLELSSEDVEQGKPIQLRFVRFQSVGSIHVRMLFLPRRSAFTFLLDFCPVESRRGGRD